MMRHSLMLVTALAVVTPLSAQTTTTRFDPVAGVPDIDKTTQTEDLAFKNRDDRMTVPVRLAGAGPYQ